MNTNKRIKKTVMAGTVIWGVIVILELVPFLMAATKAVFITDDFSYVRRNFTGIQYLLDCINATFKMWLRQDGSFVGNFFTFYFNPLRHNSNFLLHFWLVLVTVLNIVSLIYFIAKCMEYYRFGDTQYYLIFPLLFLIPFLAYREYTQVYLWFTGVMYYSLATLFFTMGGSLLIHSKTKNSKAMLAAASVLMFLAAGNKQQISGMVCYLLLLLFLLEILRKKKICFYFLTSFMAAFVGAAVSSFAPGNFVRKQEMNSIGIFRAVYVSFKCYYQELEYLFGGTNFLTFVLITFLLGCIIKKRMKSFCLIIVSFGILFTPVVTAFPVVYGYGASGIEGFSDRTLMPFDATIIGGFLIVAFLAGCQLSAYGCIPDFRNMCFTVAISICMLLVIRTGTVTNSAPYRVARNLVNGSIQEYSDGWNEIFEEIKTSDEENVVIEKDLHCVHGCVWSYYKEEPEFYCNQGIAGQYGKKSVSFVGEYTCEY